MSPEPHADPAVEARFKALADVVPAEKWSDLIGQMSELLLRRLAIEGLVVEVEPEKIKEAHTVIGKLLVDYTNLVLTCVAKAELEKGRP